MRPPLDPIDHVLALDLGGRGIGAFFVPGGALAAAEALGGARRVLIATGFTVAPDTPETDGPPGAVVLGRALRRLGADVRYVTDPSGVAAVTAALAVLDEPPDVEIYPAGDGAAAPFLARVRPSHLVAIERPGRARSGDYLNLRGEPVTSWNRRIDDLFLPAVLGAQPSAWTSAATTPARGGAPRAWRNSRMSNPARPGGTSGPGASRAAASPHGVRRANAPPRGPRPVPVPPTSPRPVTIGVGDGGNEIGMGNVRRQLLRAGGRLARTASIVRVDHLVVAATSNWGAYGIVAALTRRTGKDLLHEPALERALIQACVGAGAVDGITRRREPTVDGMPIEVHAAVVELLRRAAHAGPR